MKTVLPLNAGVDRDSYPLYIDSARGRVLNRENCRINSPDGSKRGVNVSLKGMEKVSASLPSGTNICVGYVEDKERDQGVFFNYNTSGNDGIYVFTGSAVIDLGVPSVILGFDPEYPISATILGDYCIFTDNLNPPRKIKITNDNGVTVANLLSSATASSIQLAVKPPSSRPSVQVASDPDKVVNKLVGKTFQFAYMWVYDDYTYSVLSPYSDIVVSSSVFSADSNTYTDNFIGNYVQVTFNMGTSDVRSVKLLAREGNSGEWFVVEDYDKESSDDNLNRTINFYNDVARQGLTETEALNLYSDVPRLAKLTESVENRIGLANVLKGYDKTDFDFSLAVEYEDVDITGSTTNMTNSDNVSGDTYYLAITIPAGLNVDDAIAINALGVYEEQSGGSVVKQFSWSYNFSHVVTQADVDTGDTANQIAGLIVDDIVANSDTIIYNKSVDDGTLDSVVVEGSNEGGGVVWLMFIGAYDPSNTQTQSYGGTFTVETLPSGVQTYKGGSWYNVGILGYDDYNRTSGVLSSQKIYIPHAGERDFADAFDRAKIKFTLNNATSGVASWMKKYRFAVTESINFAGVYPFVVGNDTATNIYNIFLDGQEVLAINMPTNLQYEFRKGDYLQIEVLDSESTPTEITSTIRKTILGTRTFIEVTGTEIGGFWLIVPKGSETISTYNGKLAYIYRQKDEVQDLVYYEDSQTYDISGGVMQTLSGYVGEGDAWYIQRTFDWDGSTSEVTKTVEDFYINVDDAIRAYSEGRPVVEFDSLGEIRLQDFVWSFNYLDNTKINGISTFNTLNRVQLDEKEGQINGLELVGDVLKVVQDNKETSIYVGKTQFRDGTGQLQVVRTNNFIGDTYPSNTDWGTTFPLSVVKNNRDLYYYDNSRGQIIRSSPNGQFPISDYGMKSEFLRIRRDVNNALNTDSRSVDILAHYDRKNDEYVITFDIRGNVETWAFREGYDEWVGKYDYTDASDNPPRFYGNLGSETISFLSDVYIHERTTSYNTFFGDAKTLLVEGVLNIYPNEEKCLRALLLDSNKGLRTEITSPITNTRPVGQKTLLYADTYRQREGGYTAPVFKNILQSGGSENLNLIHTGTDMVGKYLVLKFTDNASGESQLRLVTASFTVNR